MQKLVAFNFNKGTIERLKETYPIDKDNLCLDQSLKVWGPAVKKRLPSLRGKLLQDNGIEHPASLKIIDAFDKAFLFKGYEQYFNNLIPRDGTIVLAHNDAQENNVLIHLEDNEDMILIDVEYSGWNPMAFDLANYFNECVCENTNVKYYFSNYPTKEEREHVCTLYNQIYFEQFMDPRPTGTFEEYWSETKEKFIADVNKCILVNSFYWSVWIMMMISDKQVYDDNTWHWKFLKGRIEEYKMQKAEFCL